jgi:hypothetical protein
MTLSPHRVLRALSALAILSCTGAALAQPANDNCAAGNLPVIPGAGGTFTGDASAATRDGAACAGAGGEDVWYTFTPAVSATYTFSMCSTSPDWDSVLSLHPSCPTGPADNNSFACDDDFCGGFSNSQFSTALTGGTLYYVRVAGWATGDGAPFTLVITNNIAPIACCTAGVCTIVSGASCTAPSTVNGTVCSPNPCPIPPVNDECGPSNPVVSVDVPINGTTALSTTSFTITPNTLCGVAGFAGGGSDIFYRFTPSSSGTYTFSLCDSTYDTVLSVHSACPADSTNVVGCNDDSAATVPCTNSGLNSYLPSLPLTGGQTYYVRVAGYNGAVGNFVLLVTSGGPATGACCSPAGTCTISLGATCASPSVFQGDNTVCGAPACPPSGSCCSSSGDCAQTFQSGCTDTWTSGAVCTPNPCPQPPAPVNDECVNAVTLSVGAAPVNGDCYGATQTTTATCTGSTRDVWYQFTSATSQTLRVIVVPNPANAFSVAAFDACGGTQVACSAVPGDGATNQITFAATAGISYKLRVAAFPPVTNADGMFTIQITVPVLPANDNCAGAIVIPGAGGTVTGDNTDATTEFVPDPTSCGTFAFSGGAKDLYYSFTPTASGAFSVDTCGSFIDTVVSIHSGPCLASDSNLLACNDDSLNTVACPDDDFNSNIPSVNLTAGTLYIIRVAAYGDSAAPPPGGAFTLTVTAIGSPTTGACCAAGGTCTITDQAGCTGTFQGLGTSCNPNPCPQPNTGACCAAGSCSVLTQAQCSGTYQGNGTACTPNPCPQPTGACCATTGTCSILTLSNCTTLGGSYRGNGTSCLPNPCPAPAGVCCRGATCATSTSANCTGTYTAFSTATVCNATGVFTTPCCHANYNKAGAITVQDVFDFLTDWFNSEPRANISNNGAGAPTVQSVFDFLSAWFNGGCQ